MFWRLFVTYLLLVVIAVGMVGALILQRAGGTELFAELAIEVIPAVLVICGLAVIPAYVFAVRFTRPLDQLTDGADRLAEGDLGHKIQVDGSKEFSDLARTFNAMSERLAASFAQVERDREQLLTILSGMVEGVVAFDNDQRVLFVNDRAARLFEFPSDQVVGRKLWEVTRQRALCDIVEKALVDGQPHREELDWQGAVKSLAVYVSRLPGSHEPGAVMVLHDTTELRRLERLRQDFVANVSHELKTPLANIKSSVEVLIDGAVDDRASRGQFLDEIADAADRLDALIQDLLTLARIESGETGLHLEAVNVEEAVHTCLDRHRTRAEAKKLSLHGVALAGCPHDLSLWVDEEALAQTLDNLVDNAIKYTPSGGRITARWELAGGNVCIEVEDTGIGIPERDQPRVFERFYRVDKARSREMGGTGLGLAIVKHLVQAMKGNVKVTSELGKGTKFRVSLPRADR